jgi:hypothetical protein
MPLSRLNDGFEIELEGIAFGMVDRQGHRWRCLITDRVLKEGRGVPHIRAIANQSTFGGAQEGALRPSCQSYGDHRSTESMNNECGSR